MTATMHGITASGSGVVVLDPGELQGREAVDRLLGDAGLWQVHDTLEQQLTDLARTRTRMPVLDPARRDELVAEIRGGLAPETYGRWVHYPWSGRLVRLLPPEEFRELRSDRNRHKITDAEQAQLRTLTVGIVGLSVGNAIALTLALEGAFGTLKLADFDELDLSNLNRLRAGVHDIGVGKAELAARQIAELDPYADVQVFDAGVTVDNVDEFLAGVDVLVEECDSFDVKLLVRERARMRGIPVLMETSDRGMLDVERFDIEPGRPLFHGRVGDLTSAALAEMSFEDQLAAAMPVVGMEVLSARLLASMVERGQSVSTWPQLASDVTLGGATVATAVRRIALGEPLPSGRMHVDLDSILGSGELVASEPEPARPRTARLRLATEPAGLLQLLAESAARAPSGGNAQPWRFAADGDDLLVLHDRSRSTTSFDASHHAALLALGAAVENACIAAARRGHGTEVEAFPDPADETVVARVRLGGDPDPALAAQFPLISLRCTNRRAGARGPFASGDLEALAAAAASRGAHVQLRTDDAGLHEAGQVFGAADRIRFLNPVLHEDAMSELRADDDAEDGIGLGTLELSPLERTLFGVAARDDVIEVLREVGGGAVLEAGAWKAMGGASAAGALRIADPTPAGWLQGGRAVQQLWLAATGRGIGFQPMSALVFMLELVEHGDVLTAEECRRLTGLGARLDALFGERPADPLALTFRLAHVAEPSRRSGRRPVTVRPHKER